MTSKTPQEHLEWCIKRAMEYFNDGDANGATTSFISDVRKHEGTARIADPGMAMMTMAILNEAAPKSAKDFEEAMRGFAV
jgi:hypothetical protein